MSEPKSLATPTNSGKWLHGPDSDFMFAFLDNGWSAETTLAVTSAFTTGLRLLSVIKWAVKSTSGQDVVNGLYLLDEVGIALPMNSIDGMQNAGSSADRKSGQGTAAGIDTELFGTILARLSGDVAPLTTYLSAAMGSLQNEAQMTNVTDCFGTVIGTVWVEPQTDVVRTVFRYMFSTSMTCDWFVGLSCGSADRRSYDYSYTVVDYTYEKPVPVSA